MSELKLVIYQLARVLEEGPGDTEEDEQLAFLSQSLLQLSPTEFGIRPPVSCVPGMERVHALGTPESQNYRLLQAALTDPIDTRSVFTVLIRMMQSRIDEKVGNAGAERTELLRLDDALCDYDERLKYIKRQVLVEQV